MSDNNSSFFEDLKREFYKLKVREYAEETPHIHLDLAPFGDVQSHVVPIKTVDDGRCFYHAVTLNLYKEAKNGTSMPDLLKILLAIDILTNEKVYAAVLDKMKAESVIPKVELVLMILSKHHWADTYIMECVATFLQREIYSYRKLAVVSGEKYTKDYKYEVSRTDRLPLLIAYVGNQRICAKANHYVAILKKTESSVTPVLDLPKISDKPIEL